jgi:hypothetical protein
MKMGKRKGGICERKRKNKEIKGKTELKGLKQIQEGQKKAIRAHEGQTVVHQAGGEI